MRSLALVLFPSRVPADDPGMSCAAARWWRTLCLLLIAPATAVYHNIVFYPSTCILNGLGADYTPATVAEWLRHDPSVVAAVATAAAVYELGYVSRLARALAAPVFVATIPYSVWVWDIPLSGRLVCHAAHDHRVMLLDAIPLSGRLVAGVCGLLYLALAPAVLGRFRAGAPAGPVAEGGADSLWRDVTS